MKDAGAFTVLLLATALSVFGVYHGLKVGRGRFGNWLVYRKERPVTYWFLIACQSVVGLIMAFFTYFLAGRLFA